MTYCVGIEVDEGLVFAADTRTNASLDDVRVHRKLHVFEYPGQAAYVLMAAGNLATTQLLVSRLGRDAGERRTPNLRDMTHLFEAAEYVGQLLVDSQVHSSHSEHGHDGVNTQATLIFGGQIAGERPGLYMIYPLGNAIAASPETPYLQIGESKYGKPILDRILSPATRLEDAARTAIVSLDSTIRSNLSVGLPIDLALLRDGELRIGQQLRLGADSTLYADIHQNWSRRLEQAVDALPRFPGKLPNGSAGRWPATALIPPHRDAGQRPALPGHQPSASATARKTCCICSGWNRRWTPCHASPGRRPWTGSAGRWPATALIPPHRDAGQRPTLPGHQPCASATARKTCCICSGWNRRWTPCHASLGNCRAVVPAAGRQPH